MLGSVLAPVRAALAVRPGEGPAVAWAAATFFCLLAGYFVLRPVRDALPLDGDPRHLPHLFTATFVTMLAVAPVWGALVRRWPRRTFVPVCYHAFVVQLLILYALVAGDVAPRLVGQVFFVWTSVFNLFVVSVFWSLAADVLAPGQARRLFPPIAAGGTAGALVGPALTRALVEQVGVAGMLLVAAVFIELAVACVWRLDRAGTRARAVAGDDAAAAPPADAPLGGGALDGLRRVVRSPTLALIVGYVLLTTIAATFLYLEQAAIAKAALADREARAAFFAELDLWTNLGVLVLQGAITARLLGWLGVGAVLAVLPLAQGLGLGALAVSPTLTVLAIAQVATRTATHALARPARELLFTRVSREDKYKAKNVIDTLVYRFGDMGSAWLHTGLVALGAGLTGLALVFAPLAGAWLAVSVALGRWYRRAGA